jgi:hypothetical protein
MTQPRDAPVNSAHRSPSGAGTKLSSRPLMHDGAKRLMLDRRRRFPRLGRAPGKAAIRVGPHPSGRLRRRHDPLRAGDPASAARRSSPSAWGHAAAAGEAAAGADPRYDVDASATGAVEERVEAAARQALAAHAARRGAKRMPAEAARRGASNPLLGGQSHGAERHQPRAGPGGSGHPLSRVAREGVRARKAPARLARERRRGREQVEERPVATGKASVAVDERHRDPHTAARRLDGPANPAVGRSAVYQRNGSIPLPDGIASLPRGQDVRPHSSNLTQHRSMLLSGPTDQRT